MNTILAFILVVNGISGATPTAFSPVVELEEHCEAMRAKLLPAEVRQRSSCVFVRKP